MKVYTTIISKLDIRLTHKGDFAAAIEISMPNDEKYTIDLRLQERSEIEKFKSVLRFTNTRHACELTGKRVNLYLTDQNEVVAIGNPTEWSIFLIDDLINQTTLEDLHKMYE